MNVDEQKDEQVPVRPTSYSLQVPVIFAGQEVRELYFKPTSRAFRGYEQKVTRSVTGAGEEITVTAAPFEASRVMCRMAGQVEAFADQLDPADMMALAGMLPLFFVTGPPTGKTSSR